MRTGAGAACRIHLGAWVGIAGRPAQASLGVFLVLAGCLDVFIAPSIEELLARLGNALRAAAWQLHGPSVAHQVASCLPRAATKAR